LTPRTFTYEKRVYLKDTNAVGNVYFAKYFEWQGEAREDFLRRAVPNHMELFSLGIKMITVNAWLKYEHEVRLFDEILIEISTVSLKKMSMELGFKYINKFTNEIIAIGGQKLAFANHANALIPIPSSIRAGARTCLIERGSKFWNIEITKIYADSRQVEEFEDKIKTTK